MSVSTPATAGSRLHPDSDAELLADHMAGAAEVHRQIIEETIESAENGTVKEAGRTACGSVDNIRGPVARFPRAVELASCPPVDATGWWHTHPGGGEIQEPHHSIADWGNVVFGVTDASVVSGTRDAEVIVAADDREEMVARFQDAVGFPATSNRDIVAAWSNGELHPDAARRRVQEAMPDLVWRVPTNFDDLDGRLESGPGVIPTRARQMESAGRAHVCCQFDDLLSPDVGNLRENARMAQDFFAMSTRRVISEGTDEAIGVVVGTLVSNFLFGR